MADASHGNYYVPHEARWPIVGSIGLTILVVGFANMLNGDDGMGMYVMSAGILVVLYMMFRWFGDVINESENGLYKEQEDRSFRWGMSWFIFSEVMFFAAFFGALFYARTFSIPWLGGDGDGSAITTNALLWPGFEAVWPTNGPGDVGGAYQAMGPWGLPAINTVILLTSSITVTWAHWGIKESNRFTLISGLLATVLLGSVFVALQVLEYSHAYNELGLTMGSGIYGSTFFMLTGFHGFHVTMGTVMLAIILFRSIKGHFTAERHFAFEAVAWYWHFVDVVWLGLFIFVYAI